MHCSELSEEVPWNQTMGADLRVLVQDCFFKTKKIFVLYRLVCYMEIFWKKFPCMSVGLCVCVCVCVSVCLSVCSPYFGSRYLKCQCRWKSGFWQIVSVGGVAGLKEIFRSKVKGQGHNRPPNFKFRWSITWTLLNIAIGSLHHIVHFGEFYYEKNWNVYYFVIMMA